MEIQRYANMTPLGLPHYCRSDITVGNMTIPAGSRVWGLFAEIHKVCLYHMETRKKDFFSFQKSALKGNPKVAVCDTFRGPIYPQ